MADIIALPAQERRGLPIEVVRMSLLLHGVAATLRGFARGTSPSPDTLAALADVVTMAADGDLIGARAEMDTVDLLRRREAG